MSEVDESQPGDSSKQDAINDLENLGAWSRDQDDLERDVAKQVGLALLGFMNIANYSIG